MTPERLVEKLKSALADRLRAVVLYGSAAAGDHVPGRSDYNVLVVVEPLGAAELQALSPIAIAWGDAGNRPPVLFTPGELARATDVFAIELRDMQESRRVLWGDDPLVGLQIAPAHLRLELERELKGQLLRLRERYLFTRGRPARVRELMLESLSTFLVLGRAALRLYQDDIPRVKLDAMRALAQHIGFDPQVFVALQQARDAPTRWPGTGTAALFETYLKTIEQIVAAVDRRVHAPPGGNPA